MEKDYVRLVWPYYKLLAEQHTPKEWEHNTVAIADNEVLVPAHWMPKQLFKVEPVSDVMGYYSIYELRKPDFRIGVYCSHDSTLRLNGTNHTYTLAELCELYRTCVELTTDK